jgi:hypothetical protein
MFCFKRPVFRSNDDSDDDDDDDDEEEEEETFIVRRKANSALMIETSSSSNHNTITTTTRKRSMAMRKKSITPFTEVANHYQQQQVQQQQPPLPQQNQQLLLSHRRSKINAHKRCKSVDWENTTSPADNNTTTTTTTSDNAKRTNGTNVITTTNNLVVAPMMRATSSSGNIQRYAQVNTTNNKNNNNNSNRRKISSLRLKRLQSSFSPPSAFEDLADHIEAPVQYTTVERPDTPPPIVQSVSRRDQRRSFRALINNSKDSKGKPKRKSFKPGLLKSQIDSQSPTIHKMRKISIFVPHRTNGVHRVKLLAPQTSLMKNLVKEALTRYTRETKLEPVQNTPTGYSLHAAEESGCIDYEYPKLDVSLDNVVLGKLPISRFVLQPIENYLSVNRLFYESSAEIDNSSNLEDVRIRVILRYMNIERALWQVFAPDMLIRDIEKYLKRRLLPVLLPDLVKHSTASTATATDAETNDTAAQEDESKVKTAQQQQQTEDYTLTIQLLENSTLKRSIIAKTIGRRRIKELRTNISIDATIYVNADQSQNHSAEQSANRGALSPRTPTSASTTNAAAAALDAKKRKLHDNRFFIPRFIPFDYREYSVIKINKMGRRQERIFAIDDKKIYNKLPYNHAGYNFLGIQMKTRRPERPIETLQCVLTNPSKPLSFTTVFDDETLYWEAGTVVEKNEIVNTLRDLIWNHEKKEDDHHHHDAPHTPVFMKALRTLSPGPEDHHQHHHHP